MAQCSRCQGHGEVVRIYILTDSQGKEITHQQSDPCSGCGGSGQEA